jgi:HlyD family secretion protein
VLRLALAFACCWIFSGCNRTPVKAANSEAKPVLAAAAGTVSSSTRIVRATGVIQAVRTHTVRVPQLAQTSGRSPQLTLTALVPNGTTVKKGDVLVEFDQTSQLDDEREAKAKLSDLEHQLAEKRAQGESDSVKRLAQVREAEVDLGKAELQLRKGPVLADLDRRKNEVKAASARERVASLKKSHGFRLTSEVAAVRVLELKCERQKVVLERLRSNLDSLVVKAPHDGVAALETVWRSGSMGPPQVGDQLWPNQPIVRIFDPTEMVVDTQVNEPDVVALSGPARAIVHLDAYPAVVLEARLESASPVATAGLESPVKSFSARFRIAQRDPRLLPDLSASLEIEIPAGAPPKPAPANQAPAKPAGVQAGTLRGTSARGPA